MLKALKRPSVLNRIFDYPYIAFLPFLGYYLYYIFRHRYPHLYGDEGRYISFAKALLHGSYSPPAPDINLWNGPGYPIILAPFTGFKLSDIHLCIPNAVFMYLSVVFLFKAIRLFISKRIALVFAVAWGLYPNIIELCLSVYTEVFTALLITAIVYSISLFYVRHNFKYLIISALLLGFLALTKVIFGYVLLFCLVISLLAILFKSFRKRGLQTIYIIMIAFGVSSLYLIYTYKLTHRFFYWGNSGGMSLYWMSTPVDDEYGDWKTDDLHNSSFPTLYNTNEGDSLLHLHHKKDIKLINSYVGVQRDSAYKAIALSNIKQHPKKFIHNYTYNISRMLFDFPYSYYYHNKNGISNILLGSLLLWCSLICACISIINFSKLIYPLKFSLFVFGIYIILSGLLSAYPRMLDVVVPVFLFWFAFTTDLYLNRLANKSTL